MLRKYVRLVASIGFVALLCVPSTTWAQVAPPLGTAQQFGVLANSGVTGAAGGGVVVNGDVGSSPTATISNFPPSNTVPPFIVHGTNDGVVQQARIDAIAAYNNLLVQGPGIVLADNLATVGALGPGIYSFVTGTPDLPAGTSLTLNGAGIFVFNVGASMTFNVLSNVVGTANPCNIYWRVNTDATLNGTTFRGTVIAGRSITVGSGANVSGRVLAGTGATGAVTMAGAGGNTIGGCSAVPAPCPTITIAPSTVSTLIVGSAYSQPLTASGGTGSYTFTIFSGNLPAGLTLSSGGLLSGTPTTAGSSTVTIRATDGSGCPGAITYTIVVAGGLPACVTAPTVTSISSQTLPVSGSVAVGFTISGAVINNALVVRATSSDLTLVAANAMVITNGVGGARVLTVSGADGRSGVATITVTVTDPTAASCSTSTSFLVTIGAVPVPTLPPWALIALTVLVALAGFASMRRRTM
jgi:Ice-binding-like/Putative Ig domain/IPTL-CTERM motif